MTFNEIKAKLSAMREKMRTAKERRKAMEEEETKKEVDGGLRYHLTFGRIGKPQGILPSLLYNILLAYAVLMLCRIIFVAVNISMYEGVFENNSIWLMLKGSLMFDTAAMFYLNALYLVITLLPIHYKEGRYSQMASRIAFTLCNGAGIVANLCDVVYVPFTGRRSTASVFHEFSNDSNITKIIGIEALNHWYLVVIGAILIYALYRLFTPTKYNTEKLKKYYVAQTVALLVIAPAAVIGIRGGVGKAVRPIALNDANNYVSSPAETAIVLNTPFCIIRTIGKKAFEEVNYFGEDEVVSIYNPVREYNRAPNKKNVVVIILESFGKEYIGAYNPDRDEPSLTPFLDSIIEKSVTYKYSYANGHKSIDGMPSCLSSIPMFVEPLFVTPQALNKISGIAGELKKAGYTTAFYHGAPNGSMGFSAFAKSSGFNNYYGMNEYEKWEGSKGSADYDGTWAIWDEPFLQFFAAKLNSTPQPFATAVFTASSHHPFKIPEEYASTYKEGAHPIHKCVQYSDNALRKFFEEASKSSWYNNTLFIITADHPNKNLEKRYNTAAGTFEVPIIFFSPTGEAPFEPRFDEVAIAQQIDIMPTALDYVGHNAPFVAFGESLISTPGEKTFAVNYNNGIYQYFMGDYLYMFDGEECRGFYNLRNDILMSDNLIKKQLNKEQENIMQQMDRNLKAIIQQYMMRMVRDKLTYE